MTQDHEAPVVVAAVPNEIAAGIVVGALEVEGIKARMVGEFVSGFRAEAPGNVKIVVRREDAERAREVLAKVDPENVV